jgi:hypothetical protein
LSLKEASGMTRASLLPFSLILCIPLATHL